MTSENDATETKKSLKNQRIENSAQGKGDQVGVEVTVGTFDGAELLSKTIDCDHRAFDDDQRRNDRIQVRVTCENQRNIRFQRTNGDENIEKNADRTEQTEHAQNKTETVDEQCKIHHRCQADYAIE